MNKRHLMRVTALTLSGLLLASAGWAPPTPAAAVCKDCGCCTEVCGVDVFTRSDQFNAGGYLPAVAAGAEGCMGYLNCLYICPDFAITITDRQVQ